MGLPCGHRSPIPTVGLSDGLVERVVKTQEGWRQAADLELVIDIGCAEDRSRERHKCRECHEIDIEVINDQEIAAPSLGK